MGAGSIERMVRSTCVKDAAHEGWEVIFQNYFGSVTNSVFLVKNGSFLVRIKI